MIPSRELGGLLNQYSKAVDRKIGRAPRGSPRSEHTQDRRAMNPSLWTTAPFRMFPRTMRARRYSPPAPTRYARPLALLNPPQIRRAKRPIFIATVAGGAATRLNMAPRPWGLQTSPNLAVNPSTPQLQTALGQSFPTMFLPPRGHAWIPENPERRRVQNFANAAKNGNWSLRAPTRCRWPVALILPFVTLW